MLREDVAFLEERFPPSLAEALDRSGLQVGLLDAPCQRVLVALDFELKLVPDLRGVDLLLTHLPSCSARWSGSCLRRPLGPSFKLSSPRTRHVTLCTHLTTSPRAAWGRCSLDSLA